MKLTNAHREAFVAAAMQDVPKIDYVQQITDVAQKDMAGQLPPSVRKLWDSAHTRGFIHTTHNQYGQYPYKVGVTVPAASSGGSPLTAEAAIKVSELGAARVAQEKRHEALSKNLTNMSKIATTRKALADMLPEFTKYLPAEDEKTSNLPAVANLVTDFVKAGWPKQNKGRIAKAAAPA